MGNTPNCEPTSSIQFPKETIRYLIEMIDPIQERQLITVCKLFLEVFSEVLSKLVLHLCGQTLTEQQLKDLPSKMPRLRGLTITNCTFIGNEISLNFPKFDHLQKLYITGWNVEPYYATIEMPSSLVECTMDIPKDKSEILLGFDSNPLLSSL
jgi:hypothetical protein